MSKLIKKIIAIALMALIIVQIPIVSYASSVQLNQEIMIGQIMQQTSQSLTDISALVDEELATGPNLNPDLSLASAGRQSTIIIGQPTFTEGDYTYVIVNEEAIITAVDTTISGEITMPTNLGGYPITEIGERAFAACINLTKIVLSPNITYIGGWAFFECSNLVTVELPDDVEVIATSAFNECIRLRFINPPSKLTTIGDSAFSNCKLLTNFEFPEGLISIGEYAFYQTNLAFIDIPSSVQNIGHGAFYRCDSLQTVEIFALLTEINSLVFGSCIMLEKIVLPYSLKTIANAAFYNCPALDVVRYQGSENYWNAIDIGTDNTHLTQNDIKYNFLPEFSSELLAQTEEANAVMESLDLEVANILPDIELDSNHVNGPTITFLGKEIKLFDFEASLKLPVKQVPIEARVNTANKTVQVLIGFTTFAGNNSGFLPTTSDNLWLESYSNIKSLYQAFSGNKVTTPELWNAFSSIRGDLKGFNASLMVDTKAYLAGFVEISYETGEPVISNGGIIIEGSINTGYDLRFPPFPAVYGTLGLEAGVSSTVLFDWQEYFSMMASINAKLSAYAGIGAGYKRGFLASYIEGGIKGTLSANITIANGTYLPLTTPPLIVEYQGMAYLKGALLGFEVGEINYPFYDPVRLFPLDSRTNSIGAMMASADIISAAKPIERDYLEPPMATFSSLASLGSEDKIYSDSAIYDYNAPQIVSLPDGQLLMVWLDDDGSKNDANKTSLYYSVYDGSNWSAAATIHENGSYNGNPQLVADGEQIHLLWTQGSRALNDGEGLEQLLTVVELYHSIYQDGSFSSPSRLTDNQITETGYSLIIDNDNIAAIWMENSQNDLYLEQGTNTVYASYFVNNTWSATSQLLQETKPITDLTAYFEQNNLQLAYSLIENNGNQAHFDGRQIDDAAYLSYDDGYIYYLLAEDIKRYNLQDGQTESLGLEAVSNFSITDNAIYALSDDDYSNELYQSLYQNGSWQPFKQVSQFEHFIREYSVATDAAGEPVFALNMVKLAEDSNNIFTNSELAVVRAAQIYDLQLDATYTNHFSVAPNNNLELFLDISNHGNSAIAAINVQVADSQSNNVLNQNFNLQLDPGQSAKVPCTFSLPAQLSYQDYTVNISIADPTTAAETDLSNNQGSFAIGHPDAILGYLEVVENENGAFINFELHNKGYAPLEDITLTLTDPKDNLKPLATLTHNSIASMRFKSFSFAIPQQYLSLDDKTLLHGLVINVTSASLEDDYSNNDRKMLFGELTDHTVTLVDGTKIIDIIAADQLASYTYSKPGYQLEGWYTTWCLDPTTAISDASHIQENITVYAKLAKQQASFEAIIDNSIYANDLLSIDISYTDLAADAQALVGIYRQGQLIDLISSPITAGSDSRTLSLNQNLSAGDYSIELFVIDQNNLPLQQKTVKLLTVN